MKNRISVTVARNFAESLVGIFHGIPAARAKKERAEVALKRIEVCERYWEFLGKLGLSEEERKVAFSKHMEEFENIFTQVHCKRIQMQLANKESV